MGMDKVLNQYGIKTNNNKAVIISLADMDSKLFPGGPGEISINDVQQGHKATCYFLSSISALAHVRPEDIANMIEKNRDGSYTVTFPGLPYDRQKVTVDNINPDKPDLSMDPDKLSDNAHTGLNGSVWAPLMEKAFNKYCSQNSLRSNIPFFPESKGADWGLPWAGLEAITGHKADDILIRPNSMNTAEDDRNLMNKIENGLKKMKVIVACTVGKGNADPDVGDYRISDKHVYAITGIDKEHNKIELRDPYGSLKYKEPASADMKYVKSRATNGFLELSLAEFRKFFSYVAIETDMPKR